MEFDPSARITRGKLAQPLRVMIYGPPGVGKSAFAGQAPKPFFLCPEDNSNHLDLFGRLHPADWPEVLNTLRWLLDPTHLPGMGTLAIDTIDWLEPYVHQYVCARDDGSMDPSSRKPRKLLVDGSPRMEGYGFANGSKTALEEFRKLTSALDALRRARGVHVVLIAHPGTSKVKNAEDFDYDVIGPKVDRLASGWLVEWCDAVLYANWERRVIEAPETVGERAKSVVSGKRVIHTQHQGAHIAKGRDLPAVLPFEINTGWSTFYEHAHRAFADGTTLAALRAEVTAVSAEIADPAARAKVTEYLAATGDDALRLRKLLARATELARARVAPPDAPDATTDTPSQS
jgi:hypothetical protein